MNLVDVGNASEAAAGVAANLTADEYLVMMRGPKQLPLSIAVPFTIFNGLIFITGIVGNISVCVVIVKHSSMHTATNYYLFSLAVSDLTMLVFGLPNDVTVYWHQYPWTLGVWFCKFRALMSESASYVSVLTIVAFSTERYLAICHPLHLYAMSGFQRAVRIIAVLWLLALVAAAPFAAFTTVHYLDYPEGSGRPLNDSAFCAMLFQPHGWPISEISTIVFFIGPMLVIMVLYIRMGLRIRNRTRHSLGKGVKGSVHGETRHSQSRKAIIRMLASVVIAFFLCWAPFHAQRLIYIYGQDSTHYLVVNEWMFYITGLLYYVSSTVNPILYNVMSNRYRVAFKETLCGRGRSRTNGFSREHSSVRDSTTLGSHYDGTRVVRVRSVVKCTRLPAHARTPRPPSVQWRDELPAGAANGADARAVDAKLSDVVVVLAPALNGKPRCFNRLESQDGETDALTANCARAETCI